ncbi:tetratricopeptide repeat protein [Janthinobacterium sp. 17J80-10]|uniref:tetratricopeptide repeat protein n=1 Tax=Janthinobacterium sp. 17J80-10 TaxID=2497863 RepID=UPI0010055956|nr:tetratricopeptide repeat protein [Janthinobacterium sp. 17J80-10]QAU33386.1 tetratricopeptide repeat protein [Janthinobacterium sp. 17J80-10]
MKNAPAIVTLSLLLAACASVTAPPPAPPEKTETLASPSRQHTATPAQLRRMLQAGQAASAESLPPVALSPDILYKLLTAEIASQRGDWKTAYIASMALAQQTRDPRLAQRAMEIALSGKRHDEALAAIRVWRTLAPESEQATQYFLGFVMLSDNLAEAGPVFSQRLKDIPDSSRTMLMFQIQRLLARAKDKPAGFALLQQVLEPYLATPETRLVLAQGALAVGDYPRARQEALAAQAAQPESELAVLTVAQVSADKAEASQSLSAYLATYPKAREARLALARLLVEQKQYGDARSQFELLLQYNPKDLTTLYALGVLSAQTRDNPAAEKYLGSYLELLAAQPDAERDPSQALMLLSQLAEERKDTEAALRWLSQIDPGEAYIGAQIRRAQLLAKRGDLVGARKVLLDLSPQEEREQIQVLIAESQMLRDAGRLPDALAVLDSGLRRHPDNVDLLYDHAMLAEKANQIDRMEKDLRKVIVLAPKNQHAYNALGYSLADRNMRLPEAFALISKALELAPEDPFIMDSMGWVQFRLGRLKEAEEILRRAFALRPDTEIAVHLGEVLWAKGQKAEAQKFWREAREKDPQNDTLKNTLLRLQVQP